MRITDSLTTRPREGPDCIGWREPQFFRMRLRSDFWSRLALVPGVGATAAGIISALLAKEPDRPLHNFPIACGLAAAMVMLIFLFGGGQVRGEVRVDSTRIWYHRVFRMLIQSSQTWQSTPWGAIRSCTLVSGAKLGKSFSVMLVTSCNQTVVHGLPRSVDVARLEKHLASHGLTLTRADRVPWRITRSLPLAFTLGVLLVGLVVYAVGSATYREAREEFERVKAMAIPPGDNAAGNQRRALDALPPRGTPELKDLRKLPVAPMPRIIPFRSELPPDAGPPNVGPPRPTNLPKTR